MTSPQPKPTMRPRAAIHNGRRIKVRKDPNRWGKLITEINGEYAGTVSGTKPEHMTAALEQLRREIDAADLRRFDDPDAYPAYYYTGAPKPTPDQIAHAARYWAREHADRAAIAAPADDPIAAYRDAITALNLPVGLRWSVQLATRGKKVRATTEPDGEVLFRVPPGCTPEQLAAAVTRMRSKLVVAVKDAEASGTRLVPKELVSGAGFTLLGTNYRLCLVKDGDHLPRPSGMRPLTAHPGVPIIAEYGGSTWSGHRIHQLTLRKDAANAGTVIEWYRAEGQRYMDEHLPAIAQRLGVRPGLRWHVRPYRHVESRGGTWGTYLPKSHTIAVDWKIFQFPREWVDYILAHEAAHAACPERGHGRRWQTLVERVAPGWRDLDPKVREAKGLALWNGKVTTTPGLTGRSPGCRYQEETSGTSADLVRAWCSCGLWRSMMDGRPETLRELYMQQHGTTDTPPAPAPEPAGISVQIGMSAVRGGDRITLPGEQEPRTVTEAQWLSKYLTHLIVFADGTKRTFPRDSAPQVTLHERPGYGPFDEVYAVGDRVHVFWGGQDQLGVVTQVDRLDDDFCYEVYTVKAGNGAAAGVENLRRDPYPAPAVGQVWRSTSTGTLLRVTATGYNGLTGSGERVDGGTYFRDVLLAAPHWEPVTDVVKAVVTPAQALRREAEQSWDDRPTRIARSAVRRALAKAAAAYEGSPDVAAALLAEAEEYDGDGTTSWSKVRWNLLVHAEMYDKSVSRRHRGCGPCRLAVDMSAERAEQDDDMARERRRVVRVFQRYTPEQRADRAASRRLSIRQRQAVGEFYYTHPDVPGVSFASQGAAARMALRLSGSQKQPAVSPWVAVLAGAR